MYHKYYYFTNTLDHQLPPLLQEYKIAKVLKSPNNCWNLCEAWLDITLDGGPAYVALIEIKTPTITESHNDPENITIEARVGNFKSTKMNKTKNSLCRKTTLEVEKDKLYPTISIPCERPMQGSRVTLLLKDEFFYAQGKVTKAEMSMKEVKIYGKGTRIIRI